MIPLMPKGVEHLVGIMAVALLALAPAVDARDNLMREVKFERGMGGLAVDGDHKSGMQIVSDRSCRGGKCARANRPRGKSRVELKDPTFAPLHKVVWYGWSLRVAQDTTKKRLIVSQIHHHQTHNRDKQWSKTGSFIIRRDQGQFKLKHGYQIRPRVRRDASKTLGKAEMGKWYDFVVQAKWTWRGDGFVKIWLDGKLVYDHKGSSYFDYGPRTTGPRWKAGAYGERAQAMVYVDEYRVGNDKATYADVDPAGKKPEPPKPLPELLVQDITWGETGTNHVHVQTQTPDLGADPLMQQREPKKGAVTFHSAETGEELTIHRQAPAEAPRAEGWIFYLDKPHPTDPIRMVAEPGWITGAPAIDQIVPRAEPGPEPLPVLELAPGQTATCNRPAVVLGQTDGKYLIECGRES
jgi:hypothetical protein